MPAQFGGFTITARDNSSLVWHQKPSSETAMRPFCNAIPPGRQCSRSVRSDPARRGMTLVELMVAATLFTVVATGVTSCFIQALKYSESNLAQGYANQVAQSILEQVISVPPNALFDSAESSVTINLPDLNDANHTTMPQISLPWAADATTFTEIGPDADGILTDAAYVADSNVIRPDRYLRMRVNLQREIESTEHRVKIVLRYQWAAPDRLGATAPKYLSGEIRTIRSKALRF